MNRHAKVIQQRKIAHLEARLARLEREANLVQDFFEGAERLGRRLLNIPKNILGQISNAFKDALQTVAVDLEKDVNNRKKIAGVLLGTRVHRALLGVLGLSTKDIPSIHKFDENNPIKSLFVGGLAGSKPTPLGVLANMYEGEEQKRIKGAFQSWYSDYKTVFGAPKSNGFNIILEYAKKYSKALYRLLTAINNIGLTKRIIPISVVGVIAGGIVSIHNFTAAFTPDIVLAKTELARLVTVQTLIEKPSAVITLMLALIEKAFYKWGVNTEMFDEMEAQSKTASYHRRVASTSYPRIASVINYLEAQSV